MLTEKIVNILNDHWNDSKYDTKNAELAIWFTQTFDSIADDESNCETAEDVIITETDNNIIIEFSYESDYGLQRNNKITIKKIRTEKEDLVNIDFNGPLEGGDVEFELILQIVEKFNQYL